jgi:hypothetical protein
MTLDPQTLLAQSTAEIGNAIATFILLKDGASAVAGLEALAAALPKIPAGGVTSFQIGVIAAQVNAINTKANAANAGAELVSQTGSLLALVSQGQAAATGGNLTATQALLVAACQNVANGILNAVQFFLGQQSVLNPPPATAPAAAPAAS